MEQDLIVVEIPHRSRPSAWMATESRLIQLAHELELTYFKWTMEEAVYSYGDREDIPEELLDILEEKGGAIEVITGLNREPTYYKVDEAPSELDSAKEALFDDLYSYEIFTESEARAFVGSNKRGHGIYEAQSAVSKILSRLD
ncbi:MULTISPECIES: hypothetical protein [unclassified Oleiphilus]|uniref:hypothetical protein n=1 Tax=unclassified Oleiphilus TaxID=2631174 RepID=UPI0007C349D6|nr:MULTISPECIES: hypothetical protein [unclassified Oleiphilus]KZY29758.1 hypothetical protein A3729_11775 [Oleiphilus sp. HI0043]KZZ64398.1 hypothetical protein A3763_19735 [Oleiphilus sp. HI0128]KZZ67584.1 hypothetical protein A3763_15830 [Oleiphilus sp. HI0128]